MSSPSESEVFGNPVPLGLICMAIGSAALLPMCFGTPSAEGLKTAAIWALLFGAGGQFLAGIMSFVNKNTLGGTLFTTFSFLWIINWWTLQTVGGLMSGNPAGFVPDHSVILATEIILLIILSGLTYAFGYINTLLFAFMANIDLLFVVRIIKTISGDNSLMLYVGYLTVSMIAIALWLAFAMLINPVVGKNLFPIGTVIFKRKI